MGEVLELADHEWPEDSAAAAAMNVVESLYWQECDDTEYQHVMSYFGLFIVDATEGRIASGWKETPLEARALDVVAGYAEWISDWRDEKDTKVALKELARAARQVAELVRRDRANG